MHWSLKGIGWCVAQFLSALVGRSLAQNQLLIFRLNISVMCAGLITAYVGKWVRSVGSFIALTVALFMFNFFGRLVAYSGIIAQFPAVMMYTIGEAVTANIMTFILLSLWTASRRSKKLPLDGPLLLDETYLVIPFLIASIAVTALVGIIGVAIVYNAAIGNFLDFWSTQGVGLVVTLPAVLLVSQTDWRHSVFCNWSMTGVATLLTATVMLIPIAVSYTYETAALTDQPSILKVFWSVLFSIPVLALSGVILGTTGLACHLLLFSIATPMIRFLPGDFEYDDHLLALMLLLIDLSMLPFLVLLADRNRFLGSVEKQVEDRTIALVKANQEKTEFMSFLCHELRNPLHVVLSMADMAMEDNPNDIYSKAISTAARYMTDLCNDVLDATKLKSGKTDIEPKWGDLAGMLKDQCHSFSLHAATLGIKLQYHGDADVPDRLYADSLRWRQCLTNLLANACRFTKSGGNVDVSLYLIRDGVVPVDHVRLRCEVTDTGIGIDPSHIPTLFIPFSIASQQTTREYQGSGLGLSLSSMLVELMGGKLQVESQPGHGSRFWFELVVPREPAPPGHVIQFTEVVEDADITATATDSAMIELKPSSTSHCNYTALAAELPQHDRNYSYSSNMTATTQASSGDENDAESSGRRSSDDSSGLLKSSAKAHLRHLHPRRSLSTVSEEASVVIAVPNDSIPLIDQTEPLTPITAPTTNVTTPTITTLDNVMVSKNTLINQLMDGQPINTSSPNGIPGHDENVQPKPILLDVNGRPIIGALIVDDSDVNRALLKKMLHRLVRDMEVHMANDGQEAIDLAEQHKYQIIFMDLQMPRVDGWSAIAHIRKGGMNVETPIIITSANTVTISVATGCLITARVCKFANVWSLLRLQVSLSLSYFLGRFLLDLRSNDMIALAMHTVGEFFVSIIMATCLVAIWTRARKKSGESLTEAFLLDEPGIVISFLLLSVTVTAVVGVAMSAILYDFNDLYPLLEFWSSEAVGLIVTLPAVLLVSQTDWRQHEFTWKRVVTAPLLSAIGNFVFETPDLRDRDPVFKVFWSILFSAPLLALSGVLLGTTGLAINVVVFSVATPLTRYLPGDFSSDQRLLALTLLLIDLSMLPFLLLLADRNRLLGSVEKTVEERTFELVRTNQEKTEFMSFLCHELRNPLHVVLSMADMAMTDNPKDEYAKAISTAARYMTDLCNDVLDATKLKSGKTDIEPKWGDLASMLKDQCHSFSMHATTLGINLTFHGDADVPERLYTDNLRWRQCLTNLLANACRFTKSGGSVGVGLYLVNDASLPDDHVRLRCEVTDTGIGIHPSHIPTLFVPFSIASQQTTREYQGSGLGLSLSAMLVELMGGKLQVDSKPGHGSRFWFELVVTQEARHRSHIKEDLDDMDLADCNKKEHTSIRNGAELSPHIRSSYSSNKTIVTDSDDEDSGEESQRSARDLDKTGRALRTLATPVLGPLVYERALSPVTTLDGMLSKDTLLHTLLETPQSNPTSPPLNGSAGAVPDFELNENPKSKLDASGKLIVGALVVDDSDVNRALLKKMLHRLEPDMEVHMAGDGQDAIDFADKNQYRVIFMDLQMPKVDGWSAIAHIRKEGFNVQTPIIITSANPVALEGDSLGRCSVLSKPFLVKDLKAILERYV
ncbi:hypothetical protein SmJEL517_g01012 [Synchytrium microbalum]|uniref:histidine kinase n=1 Tax=Synchytrium microbalum TaxID=1806994 RepID=A0A507CHH1_9FUNG|nr:uncharacterized protein SmJEL517_g01012 [Synchytrium microbalum]TPX37135.1 hypothetical protein SmJEL517_g01012 [Synchytrium microbalum]